MIPAKKIIWNAALDEALRLTGGCIYPHAGDQTTCGRGSGPGRPCAYHGILDLKETKMDDCTHPHLTHIVNIENGGEKSTTYQCQECKQLLTVALKPFEITVTRGRPSQGS